MLRRRSPHPFALPTVGLFIEVPEADAACPARSWHWVPLGDQVPAREYVYSHRDLYRTLLSYGSLVGYTLRVSNHPKFRIIAKGLFTLRFLAEHVWDWKPQAGAYEPVDEPWILWPPLGELPEEVRKGAKATGQLPSDAPGD